MEPTRVLLGYAPLAVGAILPVLVLWDSSIRRRSHPGWPAMLQAVLGVGMLVCAGAAVIVSVTLLASYSVHDTRAHDQIMLALIVGEVVLGVFCAMTLIAGLAWPARPVPRRGFTTIVLLADVLIVSAGTWYATSMLPDAAAMMIRQF